MGSRVRYENRAAWTDSIPSAFACVLLFLIYFASYPLYAQGSCPLRLSTFSQAKSPAALWNADNIYWVSYVALPDSRYEVVIVGDTIELTPSSFSMLSRTDDRPISNWDK